jgi:hypothetical protein
MLHSPPLVALYKDKEQKKVRNGFKEKEGILTFCFDCTVDVYGHKLELFCIQFVEVRGECITEGHVKLNQREDDCFSYVPDVCAWVF